jgi:hypothetical protein
VCLLALRLVAHDPAALIVIHDVNGVLQQQQRQQLLMQRWRRGEATPLMIYHKVCVWLSVCMMQLKFVLSPPFAFRTPPFEAFMERIPLHSKCDALFRNFSHHSPHTHSL